MAFSSANPVELRLLFSGGDDDMVLMLWMTEWPQCHEGEVGEVAELSYRAITARYSARMKACVYKKTI